MRDQKIAGLEEEIRAQGDVLAALAEDVSVVKRAAREETDTLRAELHQVRAAAASEKEAHRMALLAEQEQALQEAESHRSALSTEALLRDEADRARETAENALVEARRQLEAQLEIAAALERKLAATPDLSQPLAEAEERLRAQEAEAEQRMQARRDEIAELEHALVLERDEVARLKLEQGQMEQFRITMQSAFASLGNSGGSNTN